MKFKIILVLIFVFIFTSNSKSQFAYGDNWLNNPLGFEPLKLHTSMGIILPAAAVGILLLTTKNNNTLNNKLSLYNEASFSFGYKYPNTFLPQYNVGVNYFLRDFMSVGAEFSLTYFSDDFNKTTGISIRPFARFYPVNNKNWKLYFESGGGLIYTFTDFPKPTDQDGRNGLSLNGITKYGIGGEFNLSPKTSLSFGVKHLHISNGNTKGVERNPSHDSNGFSFGINHNF